MAAIAPIVLTDGESTPVARTFAPVRKDKDNTVWYENRSTGIRIGFDWLAITPRLSTRETKATKLTFKLALPTLEVTSPSTASGIQPAPTVAYTHIGEISLIMPDRGTSQERKNLAVMLSDLLGETVVRNMIENYDLSY